MHDAVHRPSIDILRAIHFHLHRTIYFVIVHCCVVGYGSLLTTERRRVAMVVDLIDALETTSDYYRTNLKQISPSCDAMDAVLRNKRRKQAKEGGNTFFQLSVVCLSWSCRGRSEGRAKNGTKTKNEAD
jgi:hypothetical protein